MHDQKLRELSWADRLRSQRNTFWFAVRQSLRFSRDGYRAATTEKTWQSWLASEVGQRFLPLNLLEASTLADWRTFLNLAQMQKSLWTLYLLRELFPEHPSRLVEANAFWELIDAGAQDFTRAPALVEFFGGSKARAIAISGIELDAYPLLLGAHSRFDIASWIAKNLERSLHVRAQFLAADFFTLRSLEPVQTFGQNAFAPISAQGGRLRRVVTIFYPFVSPHPALAWGLPARYGNARHWLQSVAHLLNNEDLLVVVHQGEWEQEEWDEARVAFPYLSLVARKAVDCPFYPTPYATWTSLYCRR